MSQQTSSKSSTSNFETLVLPSMTPRSLVRDFGPGMMLMMTGIGTSHLVTAPVAGGRYGYALLWCLPIAYVFKYYGFEMAIRFTHATGRSMLDAYATACALSSGNTPEFPVYNNQTSLAGNPDRPDGPDRAKKPPGSPRSAGRPDELA